jgi:hypothetical protein
MIRDPSVVGVAHAAISEPSQSVSVERPMLCCAAAQALSMGSAVGRISATSQAQARAMRAMAPQAVDV